MLVKDVIFRSNGPLVPSDEIMSFRCCGVIPSGPPDEPGGKDQMAFLTDSASTVIGVILGSGVRNGRRSEGGVGCFILRALAEFESEWASESSEHTSLTAPLKFPSSSLFLN